MTVTFYGSIDCRADFICSITSHGQAGGGQNLERQNVERSIFRNFEIANIKITKDELIDSFIFDFFFIFEKLLKHSKYSIIFQIVEYWIFKWLIFFLIFLISLILKFWKFVNFSNWTISNIWSFFKLVNYSNVGNWLNDG